MPFMQRGGAGKQTSTATSGKHAPGKWKFSGVAAIDQYNKATVVVVQTTSGYSAVDGDASADLISGRGSFKNFRPAIQRLNQELVNDRYGSSKRENYEAEREISDANMASQLNKRPTGTDHSFDGPTTAGQKRSEHEEDIIALDDEGNETTPPKKKRKKDKNKRKKRSIVQ
eukprot:Clim_evm1s23 gene=Clim_evmTU1s23